jgi:hypothetical protein
MSLRGRFIFASLLFLLVASLCASPEAERLLAGLRAAQAAIAFTVAACAVIARASAALCVGNSVQLLAAFGRPRFRKRDPRGGYVPLLC